MTARTPGLLASPLTDPLATGGPVLPLTHYGGSGNGTDRQEHHQERRPTTPACTLIRHTLTASLTHCTEGPSVAGTDTGGNLDDVDSLRFNGRRSVAAILQ